MNFPLVHCHIHPDAQLIEDFHSGDQICRECGLIVGERAIDVGSEWRTFSSNRCVGDPSRVGGMENPLLTGSTLATDIENVPGPANSKGKVGKLGNQNRYKTRKSGWSVDRVLLKSFRVIVFTGESMHLAKQVINRAKSLLKEVHDLPSLRPRSKDATAIACLYIACRQERLARTFKEVCMAAKASKKEIGRCYKLITKELNIRLETISVNDFMDRFCCNLKLSRALQTAAVEIARNAVNLDLVAGRSPISVSAASIYLASQASDEKKTEGEIAEVVGIAEATIRQTYKLLLPQAHSLFPKNFRFMTSIEELPMS